MRGLPNTPPLSLGWHRALENTTWPRTTPTAGRVGAPLKRASGFATASVKTGARTQTVALPRPGRLLHHCGTSQFGSPCPPPHPLPKGKQSDTKALCLTPRLPRLFIKGGGGWWWGGPRGGAVGGPPPLRRP